MLTHGILDPQRIDRLANRDGLVAELKHTRQRAADCRACRDRSCFACRCRAATAADLEKVIAKLDSLLGGY